MKIDYTDTERLDFLDAIGKSEDKDGIRLFLVAFPYKIKDGEDGPQTMRGAIDYIMDDPEAVQRAMDARGLDILGLNSAKGGVDESN